MINVIEKYTVVFKFLTYPYPYHYIPIIWLLRNTSPTHRQESISLPILFFPDKQPPIAIHFSMPDLFSL